MKDRYKFVLLCGATCIVVMLVYFWLRSSHQQPHHPSLSHPATTPKNFMGTPMPMSSELLVKKFYEKVAKIKDVYKNVSDNINDGKVLKMLDSGTEYTVNTPGCKVPLPKITYLEHSKAEKNNRNILDCGNRAVFLKKINNTVLQVSIEMTKLKKYFQNKCTMFGCYYQFFNETTRGFRKALNLTLPYQEIYLETDFVNVRCSCDNRDYHKYHSHTYYDDLFAFTKRKFTTYHNHRCQEHYNVLMLGLDSMSLARLEQTMPMTVGFFNKSALSFRGYHKVGDNTFPNLMAALSGYNLPTLKKHCLKSIDRCDIIWKKFQNIGYTTAYGEDFLGLPNTFGGDFSFYKGPTDHHIKPLFFREETEINKTLICTGKAMAGQQLLDYATDFVSTYQHRRFFGIFWLNSFSHNENSRPQDADRLLKIFFNNTIGKMGILKNTFVIFFSDQGLRFGKNRMKVDSYYEERLPFLFIFPPTNFRERYAFEFQSLKTNQRRLVTPYDLYNTLYEIYRISGCKKRYYESVSHACRNCQSLFIPISTDRRCQDVAIGTKWCSCHKLKPLKETQSKKVHSDGTNSVLSAVSAVKNKTQSIKTKPAWICADMSLYKIIRIHYYYDEDKNIYFVVAFTMSPGNVSFEATVFRSQKVTNLRVISPYKGLGNCTADPSIHSRLYCICEKNKACFQ